MRQGTAAPERVLSGRERRVEYRLKLNRGVGVVLDLAQPPCDMLDLSVGGAKLRVRGAARIELGDIEACFLVAKLEMTLWKRVTVLWRDSEDAAVFGVRFANPLTVSESLAMAQHAK